MLIFKYLLNLFFISIFIILISHSFSLKAQSTEPAVVNRVILIGDAGRLINGKSIVSDAIANYINKTDTTTTIVFLGDNIYDRGLPEKENKEYAESEEILLKQLKVFEDHKAKVYMIPGNHDWQKSGPLGWERIKRQSNWVDSLGKANINFFPKDGCPGPEEIMINDKLVLLIVDTQWWLHPYDKPGISDNCNCKTEDEIIAKLKDIAYRNRDKRIIFASHHPMRSNGIHGGYYTLKQHIFPFTEMADNAYIPLPIIGSLYPLVRGTFGNVQDLKHPEYKNMVQRIEEAMSVAPDVIYAAGHDHSLQLIQEGTQSYIVSGSGINRERVRKTKDSPFVTDQRGYVEIEYRSDGTEKIIFHEVNEQSTDTKSYSTVLPSKQLPDISNETISNNDKPLDSIKIAIAPQYDKVSGFHRFWFGKNYRKIWATPVTLKVFYIGKENFKILEQGGGQQTKSLRMVDANGKEWVLRGVQKDPAKALPVQLRKTVAKNIVQDQISAAQPYAPLTVPVMAEAMRIPHANPRLVFIPDDPALGFYRKDFANTVCVLEEREPVSKGNTKTYNTPKVLEKLREDNTKNRIDEIAVLKARMLDLLIGDWDRHEDQWRWEKREENNTSVFSPIPRDRDQVYFINSGLLPYIASRKWLSPKFQGFGKEIRDVNGFMYNARYFDRFFLHELEEEDWKQTLLLMQQTLTDSILYKAVKQLPDTIYAQCGEEIYSNLISRRNSLYKNGLKFYKFLSKTVEIPGSDKNDYFELSYKNKKALTVKVYKLKKDGTKGTLIYERNFNKKVTNEIRLYGLGGEDVFKVNGKGRSLIKVRMIGGDGLDSFNIDKKSHNKFNIIVYDRSDKKNVLPGYMKAVVHSSEKNSINEYNGRTFKYNQLLPQASGGFNVDDGLWLGAGAQYTKHGFRKEPYSRLHRLIVGHALATNAWNIKYYGHFVKLLGNNDLKINFDAKAPDNVSNFFGVGNETKFIRQGEHPITYYRTRYNFISGQMKLEHAFAKSFKIYGGIVGQYYSIDSSENIGRFINLYNTQNPDQHVYSRKSFGGLIGGFQIDTRNSEVMPIRGIYWNTNYSGLMEFDDRDNRKLGRFETDMTIYNSFRRDPRLVIINKIGGGYIVGHPYFFQMNYLGGSNNLLGFRNYRFAGNSKAYYNLELRFKLFDFSSYLFPGSVGLIAFNSVGRVWVQNESSDLWHDGYGGGFYIMPANMLLVNMTLGFSKEGVLPYISIGVKL